MSELTPPDPLISEPPAGALAVGHGAWIVPRRKKGTPAKAKATMQIEFWRDRLMHKWRAGGYTLDDMRKFAKDETHGARRIAAISIMKMADIPDLADYEEALTGDKSLKELREQGIDTSNISRYKIKTRHITTKDGEVTEEREANIDLKDDYFKAWDRTVEKPKTRIDMGRDEQADAAGSLDLSSLSPAELETMLALAEKAGMIERHQAPTATPPEITVTATVVPEKACDSQSEDVLSRLRDKYSAKGV